MSERVLAIVVTHNPQIAALQVSLRAVAQQVDAAIIIDNASDNLDDIRALLVDIQDGSGGVLAQKENLGLGAAHNIGIRHAREHGFSHCLLLDQDSVPLDDMVRNLVTASQRKSSANLSAVGATYINADTGGESFFVRFGWLKFRRQYCGERDADGCIEADFLISSGSLISLAAIDQVGKMDESLFIDHVDTEWFLRARAKGLRAFGVCDAVMQHGLGEQTHRINLRRQRNIPQHKPFRYYYIFRNSVALYKRGYASALWKWNDLQRLILIAVMFALFKSPRRANAKMMLRGVIDGFRGVSGRVQLD
ncbi:MAG: glycosyltransferase family 2 protein [Pseudomonadota bacterium]